MRIAALAILCACGSHHSPPVREDVDASVDIDASVAATCLPYDPPAIDHSTTKKVFAHYFAPFPISIDNKPAASDYYTTQFLAPGGEAGKHLAYGGYLRERPLPQEPDPNADFASDNLKLEVERADAIGLDGFTFDILGVAANDQNWIRLTKLLAVIPTVDPEFKVQLVFDMTAAAFKGADAAANIATVLAAIGDDASLLRVDGRLVVSAFAANAQSAAFWNSVVTAHDLSLIPMPVGGWSATPYAGVDLFGASSWGVRTVAGAAGLANEATTAHGQGLLWMAPVAPQDSRPKDFNFTESNNSAAFRGQWLAAIGSADWVQMITWNDYSEDSEIAPSSQTQHAFYDLTGYYTAWFKTGVQPPIERDALYYFYRAHSMDPAVAAPTLQMKPFVAVNGAAPSNTIELVGFLTAPGTLEIDGMTKDVDAGIQSFEVPLVEGTPTFKLLRNGTTVIEVGGATAVDNAITYQDPLYHAGSSCH